MLVAVDTGGTKTLVAGFSEDGIIGEQVKFPTPKNQDEYTAQLRSTLKNLFGGQRVEAIVIGLPGIIKNDTAVWCENLKWSNFNVVKALDGVLGDTPILVENDANLAGLAETRILRSTPESSLYVTVSTGIGTGVITNGTIDQGLRHSEGGHALVEYDGLVRKWESFSSGQAIHDAYGMFAHDIHSKRVWNQIADRISRGFLAVVPIIQPDVIIIGGSIGTYFDQFAPQLENILREKLPAHIPCPIFRQAQHPEQAVIYGCYYYALDTLSSKTA